MTNTVLIAYAGKGLVFFTATDENLERLPEKIKKLNIQGDDFTVAATRLMDAASGDWTKGDLSDDDLLVAVFLAVTGIGEADRSDPGACEILSHENLVAVMTRDDDSGRFNGFVFEVGDERTLN